MTLAFMVIYGHFSTSVFDAMAIINADLLSLTSLD